jgi:hypothetical protein
VLHMHCVVYFYPRVRKVQCSDHVIVATRNQKLQLEFWTVDASTN